MATTIPQLDSDAIKMFIGQIPKTMNETDLKKFLEDYGPIHDLNILRDRSTGVSKGCAFVTFCTRKDALDAQMALHNLKVMPGLSHPIQMKPADGQINSVEERRLFVGMLAKSYSEADVTMMFASFGTIDDCVVLKDAKGDSKGCAFVTFASKACAQNAIRTMHHSQTMEGCKLPIVAKIADTQKDKDAKKYYQTQSPGTGTSMGGMMNQGLQQSSQYLSLLQQACPNNTLGALANLTNQGIGGMNAGQLQQLMMAAVALAPLLQSNPGLATFFASLGSNMTSGISATTSNVAMIQQLAAAAGNGGGGSGTGNQLNTANNSFDNNSSANMYMQSSGMDSMTGFQNSSSSMQSTGYGGSSSGYNSSASGFSGTSGFNTGSMTASGSSTDMMNKAYSGILQYMAGLPNSTSFTSSTDASLNSQSKGPEGANLFIYHLPRDCRDPELTQMFLPFGSLISAKVFIDKNTNQSKCFGFVSYESPLSAQSAIQAMNGFQIGSKRLKVSLKNSKMESKPY